MSDQEEEVTHLSVNDLTEIQWDEIRGLARNMISSQMYGRDPFKCTVTAFLHWIAHQEENLAIGVSLGLTDIHH